MATVAINLYSDLQQPVPVQYIDGNMFSMDNAGNTVNVYVNDGGEPATLSGSVSALVIRPDGATVAVTGALDGNMAYVIMPQAVYSVPGVVSVVVKLTDNTTVTTIAAFVANVYQSSTDTVVDPGTIIPSVQNLISAINAAVASIPADYSALWATLAPAYSSKTYAVGDYCTNGGVLYRCIVPITAAESWTAAHWTAANIGNDLSALKSALGDISGNNVISGWVDNAYLKTNNASYDPAEIVGNNDWRYVIVQCASGDSFTINGAGGQTPLLWSFVDANNNYLTPRCSENATAENLVITAPEGAVLLIINDNLKTGICYYGNLLVERVGALEQKVPETTAALQAELEDIKSIETVVTEWVSGAYINDAVNIGQTVNLTPVTNSQYRFSIVNVSRTAKIFVDLIGGNSPRAWCFIDNENKLISNSSTGAYNGFVKVPEGTEKIIFNDKNSGGSAKLYTADGEIDQIKTDISNSEPDAYSVAKRANESIEQLRKLQNGLDERLDSLSHSHGETSEQTITIPTIGAKERHLLRIGLHYGSPITTHDPEEVFFNGLCRTDFSDVRFFDSDGNMLKAEYGKLVNLDLIQDNRMKNVSAVLSDGRVITSTGSSPIYIYSNNMSTSDAISGTHNVTENGSDVYNYKSMMVLYVDTNDNIFAYAGGHLYKLLASDNYATKLDVLNFTWTYNGTTIYPDAQAHSIDVDTNGNMIFGTYARDTFYHTDIFKSTDGGNSWTLCWHNYDGEYMHVHHVHADKWTGAVYVGVDDGSSTYSGGRILKTTNGGSTWTDITNQIMESALPTRGKDFFPCYCGNGYRLGSAESYIMGSATIYRSTDDQVLFRVVGGSAGAREIVDFQNDSLLIAGTSQSIGVSENHILISTDKGKTWDSIYTKYQTPSIASAMGFRRAYPAKTIDGDTEPCVIIPADIGNVPSFRLYKGGNHWYREAFILLENVENADINLTVKTGYNIGNSFKSLRNDYREHLVYRIPLNEGAGRIVSDSNGKTVEVVGDYEWELYESGRYGDQRGENNILPFEPRRGILLKNGGYINFGANPDLAFNKSYTITCWFNTKGMFLNQSKYVNDISKFYNLFDIGSVKAYKHGLYWFIGDNTSPITDTSHSTLPRSGTSMRTTNYNFTDQYYLLALSVDSNNVCTASIFGETTGNHTYDYAVNTFAWRNLSVGDIKIGGDTNMGQVGYISDIRVYDVALSLDDVLDIYRGIK